MSRAAPLNADSMERLWALMSDISEEHCSAMWLIDLEYSLWRIVLGGDPGFGLYDVSPERVAELRRLSEECGGWMVWLDGGRPFCPTFVPLDEWKELYAKDPTRGPGKYEGY